MIPSRETNDKTDVLWELMTSLMLFRRKQSAGQQHHRIVAIPSEAGALEITWSELKELKETDSRAGVGQAEPGLRESNEDTLQKNLGEVVRDPIPTLHSDLLLTRGMCTLQKGIQVGISKCPNKKYKKEILEKNEIILLKKIKLQVSSFRIKDCLKIRIH